MSDFDVGVQDDDYLPPRPFYSSKPSPDEAFAVAQTVQLHFLVPDQFLVQLLLQMICKFKRRSTNIWDSTNFMVHQKVGSTDEHLLRPITHFLHFCTKRASVLNLKREQGPNLPAWLTILIAIQQGPFQTYELYTKLRQKSPLKWPRKSATSPTKQRWLSSSACWHSTHHWCCSRRWGWSRIATWAESGWGCCGVNETTLTSLHCGMEWSPTWWGVRTSTFGSGSWNKTDLWLEILKINRKKATVQRQKMRRPPLLLLRRGIRVVRMVPDFCFRESKVFRSAATNLTLLSI